jgi:hypothetical protein
MKRALLFCLMITTVWAVGAPLAGADSDNNAALVVKYGEGCRWYFGDLAAEGSVHQVVTQNGRWKLSCIGQIVDGLPLDHAVQVKSTFDDPRRECGTPFGDTLKWHATFAPSGKSSFVCQGDLAQPPELP